MATQFKSLSEITVTQVVTRSNRVTIGRAESGRIIQLLNELVGSEIVGDTGKVMLNMHQNRIVSIDFPPRES